MNEQTQAGRFGYKSIYSIPWYGPKTVLIEANINGRLLIFNVRLDHKGEFRDSKICGWKIKGAKTTF